MSEKEFTFAECLTNILLMLNITLWFYFCKTIFYKLPPELGETSTLREIAASRKTTC
jgi:hypothetical protein